MAATSRCTLRTESSSHVGLMDRPDDHGSMRTMVIRVRYPREGSPPATPRAQFLAGIATPSPYWRRTASQADAAATIIARCGDLPGIRPLSAVRHRICNPTAILARAL